MFCPECGKPNPEENKACQYCGAWLIDNYVGPTNQQPVAAPTNQNTDGNQNDMVVSIPKINSAKTKKFFSKAKFVLIPAIILAVAVIAFVAIGTSLTSPEKVVKKYYNAIIDGDYEAVYDYLALPDSEFISKESYINYMENSYQGDNSLSQYKSFQVKPVKNEYYYEDESDNKKDESPVKMYEVIFVDRSTGSSQTTTVTLIEQYKKTLLFFKNYKVASSDLIVQNVELEIIGDAEVAIDGTTLENYTFSQDENRVYKIDAIFGGAHTLTLSSDLYETYEEEIYFNDDMHKYFNTSDVLKLKEEVVSLLEEKAFSDIKNVYKYAIEQKPFPTNKIKIAKGNGNVTDCYDDLVNRFTPSEDGTGIKSITFNSGTIRASRYSDDKQCTVGTDENGNLYASFYLELGYDYTRVYTDWFTSELTTDESKSTDTVMFKYVYSDEKWVLSELRDFVVYY